MTFIRKQSWLIICCILFAHKSYNQNSDPQNLYSWFDNTTGNETLSLNNGPVHYNTFRTADRNNFRYLKNEFLKGNVIYDDQKFYDVALKYDLFTDALLYQPEGTSYAINLIKEKVTSFSLDGKQFKNLTFKDSPDFTDGYYEESVATDQFVFYTKHVKKVFKVAKEKITLSEFRPEDSYLLHYQNKYTKIASQKNVVSVFPEQKAKINNFYSMNKNLSKSDTHQFMKNLFVYINQIIK